MTSKVTVTAHPGTGVNHVLVRTFNDEGEVFQEDKVRANETRDFYVHSNHNLEICEDLDEEEENA